LQRFLASDGLCLWQLRGVATGRAWPRLRPIPVRFGEPLSFEPDRLAPNDERHRRIADQLHDAVAALAQGGRGSAAPAVGFDDAEPPRT